MSISMKVMSNSLQRFIGDKSGATAVEYALLSSMIALVIIAALSALGTQLGKEFNEVSGALK